MYKVYYPLKGASNQKSSEIMDPSRSTARIYDAKLSSALNSSATLTFTIDPSNPMYSQIEMRGDRWVYVYWDDTMLFKGFIVDTIRNADLTLTVTAKDAIYDMGNVKFRFASRGLTSTYYSSTDYVTHVMQAFSEINMTDYAVSIPFPFNAGRPLKRHDTNMVVDVEPKKPSTVYDYMRPLIEQYGCYMVMRDGGISVATKPLQDTSVTLRLGETIKDIKVEVNEQDFPTAVYAMGGRTYPVWISGEGPYSNRETHFVLVKDSPIGTSRMKMRFDRSISNYQYESMYIYHGGKPSSSGVAGYSYVQIDFHPSRTHTEKNYTGYGQIYITKPYIEVNDGDTVDVLVDGVDSLDLKTSDNIDIIVFWIPNGVDVNHFTKDCIPRLAGAAGPDIASDENPIATTYEGVRLWVDYNTIIMRDLAEQYGVRTIDIEDETIRNPDVLFDKAFTELVKNAVIGTRVTVDAIDPAIIDGTGTHLRPGDSVNVESEQHGLTGRMVLSGMELDLNTPANNRYSLGNLATTVTDKIALLNAKIASVRNLAKG